MGRRDGIYPYRREKIWADFIFLVVFFKKNLCEQGIFFRSDSVTAGGGMLQVGVTASATCGMETAASQAHGTAQCCPLSWKLSQWLEGLSRAGGITNAGLSTSNCSSTQQNAVWLLQSPSVALDSPELQ